jgi:hypothetical protein
VILFETRCALIERDHDVAETRVDPLRRRWLRHRLLDRQQHRGRQALSPEATTPLAKPGARRPVMRGHGRLARPALTSPTGLTPNAWSRRLVVPGRSQLPRSGESRAWPDGYLPGRLDLAVRTCVILRREVHGAPMPCNADIGDRDAWIRMRALAPAEFPGFAADTAFDVLSSCQAAW